MFGIKKKLCKPLVCKYVFGIAMQLLISKLFKFKVIKGLFGHPVYIMGFKSVELCRNQW